MDEISDWLGYILPNDSLRQKFKSSTNVSADDANSTAFGNELVGEFDERRVVSAKNSIASLESRSLIEIESPD